MILFSIIVVGAVFGVLMALDERWMNDHNRRLEDASMSPEKDDLFGSIARFLRETVVPE